MTGFKIAHLPNSLKLLFYAYLFKTHPHQSLVIPYHSSENYHELKEFYEALLIPYYHFPFYDLLPYEEGKVNTLIQEERISFLFAIQQKQKGLYFLPLKSFLFPIQKYDHFIENLIQIQLNESINRSDLLDKLIKLGYKRFPSIENVGSFALRGEILDIYSPQYENPIRIYFFDTQVEQITFFSQNPESKLEKKTYDEVTILPLYDFIMDATAEKRFVQELSKEFGPEKIKMLREQNNEYNIHLAPFFYEKYSILDFFKDSQHDYRFVLNDKPVLESEEKNILREIKELYFSHFNSQKLMIPSENYYISFDSLIHHLKQQNCLELSSFEEDSHISLLNHFASLPDYKGRLQIFETQISQEWQGYEIFLIAQNQHQQKQLQDLFPQYSCLVVDFFFNGFIDKIKKTIYITQTDLFGKKRKSFKHEHLFLKNASPIESFSDIERGDFVVHIQHGIGIYQGIEKVSILGSQKDYIKIIYADEEVLYIPIEQIFLVHKYLGNAQPALNNLGGKKWEQKKSRVAKKLEEMSEELAVLYESRKQIKGFSFPPDTDFQKKFEASFPYEETQGQLEAIQSIKNDMQSPFVMDRLICGDVGFGKTEVAFRAIFKAIHAGKQVALLVPTTLLAEQHYHSILERFQDFNIQVGMLSRLVKPLIHKKNQEQLANGSLDLIVGTHAILSPSLKFHNLGLLVIDEEQRFGVKHKERIKMLKQSVDVLTLSATPIPRTLYMGLSQIRDMSLITTPPFNRLPIKTHVLPFNDNILKLAIDRELERKGQIFIIHNKIKTIEAFGEMIQQLCPQARIIIGHAQMPAQEMEDVFLNFINYQYDILISTTIIENGIDIPNANTIIIHRPELLGLSELYQLRGRVGRAEKQGYAYLFYDSLQGLTPTMKQRLEALEENTELGSGFKIAMRDLEIRGAGNLLGKDQSGDLDDIGIELYTQMLQDVTHKVQGHIREFSEPLIDLALKGSIPEIYIPKEQERFYIYKMIMCSQSEEDLSGLLEYLEESYGKIPQEINQFILAAQLKIACKILCVKEMKQISTSEYLLLFFDKPILNTKNLTQLIQTGIIQIKSTESCHILIQQPNDLSELMGYIHELIP